MLSITYISAAVQSPDNAALFKMLAAWRSGNQQFGITGLLLYKAGSFIQTIEGEDAAVLTLFKNIKRDPFHRNVVAVMQETIQERHFDNWSMGFQLLGRLGGDTALGFNALLSDPQMAEIFARSPHRVDKLHWMFREISSRA